MRSKTHIEWTEATWNPVTGCSKVSAGCKNCYAERMAGRLASMGNIRYRNGFGVTLHKDLLDAPRKWKAPRIIFVNSMSDLFHEDVPIDFIERAFKTMNECPQHTFQILTKRSKRLREVANRFLWTQNIWMGVSVEDSRVYDRITDLGTVQSHVRFLSCEPLIGPTEDLPLDGIHWVIVGGESGPGARPMDEKWVISIKDQCKRAGVAFFFKQWGGAQKHRYGRKLDEKTYSEMPNLMGV